MTRAPAIIALLCGLAAASAASAQTLCAGSATDPEQRRAATIASASYGSCSGCADPAALEVTDACRVPASETQACAAEVVERVAEALILDLKSAAPRDRLSAIAACLGAAGDQLRIGAEVGTEGAHWPTRRTIALEVAQRLKAEVNAETALVTDAELKIKVDNWLGKGLPKTAHEGLEKKADDCPDPATFPEGWEGWNEKTKVNCALLVIAAAQADLTDIGGPLSPGDAPREPLDCAREGAERNPACCLFEDPDGQLAGDYRFQRRGKTFRATMGDFCTFADNAGLLPPGRMPEVGKVISTEDLLAAANKPPTSADLRATAEFLADRDLRQTTWDAAKTKAEEEIADLDMRIARNI